MAVFKNSVGIPDQDAINFINTSGITSPTQLGAINRLVLDLKGFFNPSYATSNIWGKMKAVYPMVGQPGVSSSFEINLKNPNQFRGIFSGSWTFSSTGAKPDGSTGYMNTGFNASTDFLSNSRHMSFYNRTNTAKGYDMGAAILPADIMLASRFSLFGASAAYTNFGDIAGYTTVTTEATGFFQGNNISNTEKLYKNGSQIATRNNTIVSVNMNIYIGASNRNGTTVEFTDHECAFASIGDGLTDTEAANLYTAVQRFQTTLGRQV